MDVDLGVRSLRDVGVGDVVAFIEQQATGPGLAVIGGEEGGEFFAIVGGVRHVPAMADEQEVA